VQKEPRSPFISNNLSQRIASPLKTSRSNQDGDMQEKLQTKEEEVQILWNVIKQINKGEGDVHS